MGPNDGEVEDFIWDIEPALWAAGWTQVSWGFPAGAQQVITRNSGVGPVRLPLGFANVSNVKIELHPNSPSGLSAAAQGLAAILRDIGIEAHVVGFNVHNVNPNAMHILIGPKR
jgi:hypothetical protein